MKLRYRHGGKVRWQLQLKRWHLAVALGVVVVLIAIGAWLFAPFWELTGQFSRSPSRLPSRLYGRALVVQNGDPADLPGMVRELQSVGYREAKTGSLLPGDYRLDKESLAIYLRAFPTTSGWVSPHSLEVQTKGGKVRSLKAAGRAVERAQLEPPIITSFYGRDLKERRPVRLEQVPPELVLSILAAEDARFFEHGGVSLIGILRAMFANLRGGAITQGGSTLTQQLVKNLYLTHARTVSRKAREAVLATLVDLRYSKREILEAYMNEIYLGASGSVNLMGVGAASWAYFGKEPARLTLSEAATLAGMIPAPARFEPVKHPEAAQVRRDLVLTRLERLGWIPKERLDRARAEKLVASPHPIPARRAAYFTDLVLRETADRYTLPKLEDGGYVVLSTMSLRDQRAAETDVSWGLAELEKGWEKGRKGRSPLQGALVSVDPAGGGIRAYVGGRDYKGSQFDRAGVALRQPGSAFKPVVYAAALRSGAVTPATLVEDSPVTYRQAGSADWSPENSDHKYRGWVNVRTALEDSLNVPTARVAEATGMPNIVALARAMGVAQELRPMRSVALGALEVTPLDMATVYATLASGGVRPPVHAVDGVLGTDGRPVPGKPLPPSRRVLEPEVAYVVTNLLQGVLVHGTGAGVHRYGLHDPLAAKTGTSNDAKDSWLCGYSPQRATVVWVGYDESLATRLSGSRGALPIWAKFMADVRPASGYPNFRRPQGVVEAVVDPTTGQLATDGCPYRSSEVFVAKFAPRETCVRHGGWYDTAAATDDGRERRHGGLRGWLDKVFGDDEDAEAAPPSDDGGEEEDGGR